MSAGSGLGLLLAGLCLLAALVAAVQILRHARRGRVWLAWLQVPCALLLLYALLLRDAPPPAAVIVLGQHADLQSLPPDTRVPVVALPESGHAGSVPGTPDLATLLRRTPEITHVHVVGDGLQAHDLAALGERELSIQSSTTPSSLDGLVELDAPTHVVSGQRWSLQGRVGAGVETVALLDPAQQRVAQATPDDNGRFHLTGVSRAAGPVLFELGLRAGDDELQRVPLPIQARAARPVRALVLAATPSPELKYLRRWASDAGLRLDSHIALAPGVVQAGATPALDADALAQLDLLIVDERSWAMLDRQADLVREAVRGGLGLLLRVTGPVPESVLQRWKSFGVDLEQGSEPPQPVRLDGMAGDAPLHAWPIVVRGDRHVVAWQDDDARALATRYSLGQGRIGVLWLTDSFRLHTRGDAARHATLWSTLATRLARPRGQPETQLPARAVIGQRAVICRPQGELRVKSPDAEMIGLQRDPDNPDCAAFWPRTVGWHRVLAEADVGASGASTASPPDSNGPSDEPDGEEPAFYVFDPRSIDSLLAAQRHAATRARVNRDDPPAQSRASREPLRAAVLLGWLILIATSWWGERRARRAPQARA